MHSVYIYHYLLPFSRPSVENYLLEIVDSTCVLKDILKNKHDAHLPFLHALPESRSKVRLLYDCVSALLL